MDIAPDVPRLLVGDALRLSQVLLNLGYQVSGSDLSQNAATRRLLVVSLLGQAWALLVDEIAGLRVVEETSIRPAPCSCSSRRR